MSRTFAGVRRTAFALLLAPCVVFVMALQAFGVPEDSRIGLVFVPVLALVLWNRRQERDRFYGLGIPTLVLVSFFSLAGFTQHKTGLILESLHALGMAGTMVALFWVMTLLLTLWGAPKRY